MPKLQLRPRLLTALQGRSHPRFDPNQAICPSQGYLTLATTPTSRSSLRTRSGKHTARYHVPAQLSSQMRAKTDFRYSSRYHHPLHCLLTLAAARHFPCHVIEPKEDDPALVREVLQACYTCSYDDTVGGDNKLDFKMHACMPRPTDTTFPFWAINPPGACSRHHSTGPLDNARRASQKRAGAKRPTPLHSASARGLP